MKSTTILLFLLFLLSILGTNLTGQQVINPLTQTIKGTIYDIDSHQPLLGAEVLILGSEPLLGITSDIDGTFKIENVPIGRADLQFTYLGYEPQVIPNIVVNSAKEVILEIFLQESILTMDVVEVTASQDKGTALNEMTLISAGSISAEETNRYAGGFNDPSRILSNFAGVTSSQDGGNDIIVRGNSPKYIQWRLEGVTITNPNHFGDPSAVGGSVSTLNNNMLGTSDFHTSAFTPEFGNALSGVYDVKLRNGNNEKFEAVFGFGILGTDITLEGPLKKGKPGSFLFNYRYSTAGLASDIGLIDVGGVPTFQDASFKVLLPTQKSGTFSLFGLAGLSKFLWEKVTPSTWVTPGDNFMRPDIYEDYNKKAHLLNIGLNHSINLSSDSYLKSSLLVSDEGVDDKIFETEFEPLFDEQGEFSNDSIIDRRLNFSNQLNKTTYRSQVTYHKKFSAKSKLQVGANYALIDYGLEQSQLSSKSLNRNTLVNMDDNISSIGTYLSWKFRMNENITMVTGVHNFNLLFTNESTLEPRIAFQIKTGDNGKFNLGYGNHSTMESVHNYFAKVPNGNGSMVEPNRNLDLLRSNHFVLGYEFRLAKRMNLKLEAYYQQLYNLPVENSDTSYYATINEGLEFRYVDLVNEGKGKNYGLEITLERFFHKNFYYLINASVFTSKYTALDGVERNSQFSGDYLVNALIGKEFVNIGKKENQTLGLNAKVFVGGGKKIIALLRNTDGNLAVQPEQGLFYDYNNAYENKLDDIFQVTLSASYKWNKPKTTHELFLNIDNVNNRKARLAEYYDENEEGNIGYQSQFGIFPNLMYRLYF